MTWIESITILYYCIPLNWLIGALVAICIVDVMVFLGIMTQGHDREM